MSERTGVAVVGSINADLTAFGTPLPRPGETVTGDSFSMTLGGKGANQAVAAARAGAPTFMIGAVGGDLFGDLTLGMLTAAGVDVARVRIVDGPTGIAHIRVDAATGQNDIVVVPHANHRLSSDDVASALRALAGTVSVVLVQLEIPLDVVVAVSTVCRELDLRLILDPAPAQPLPDSVWPGVFLAKPNESEAAALTGAEVRDRASAVAAARWFTRRGVPVAVITLGAAGAVVVSDDRVDVLDPYPVEVVDTTAAGDAFTGALAAGLASGRPLAEALDRAMAAAALAVTVRGASPSLPTDVAVDEFLAGRT
jgi:ribokinase